MFPAAYVIMTESVLTFTFFFLPFYLTVLFRALYMFVWVRTRSAVLCRHNVWPCVGVSLKAKAVCCGVQNNLNAG